MSARIVPYKQGGWEVDIRLRLPNGSRHRERRVVSHSSKATARRWAEDRVRHLLQHGLPQSKKEVPTFQEFAPRFMDGYARANRQKPSGIAAKETILRVHLTPLLGPKKLDAITSEVVQGVKGHLQGKAPKTVNNVLTVLNKMLKTAVEWDAIKQMPCTIKALPTMKPSMGFHSEPEYERLLSVGERRGREVHLMILLAGDAGLRLGEIVALEWRDIDFETRRLTVQRADWLGVVSSPKGGRLRRIPLTRRLAAALKGARHLRSPRVLCLPDGAPITRDRVIKAIRSAQRVAQTEHEGVHVLRHTFCSHLAMRGAGARAIQEVAGHADLSTTQRYMHLSPSAIEEAIRLLDRGDYGEARDAVSVSASSVTG